MKLTPVKLKQTPKVKAYNKALKASSNIKGVLRKKAIEEINKKIKRL